MFALHGIDFDTTGVPRPMGRVIFDITGVPAGTTLVISDDADEFTQPTPTSYRGNWTFMNDTDGGVIQYLPLPGSWVIHVVPTFTAGITAWRWVDEPALFTSFSTGTEVILRAYPTPSLCRTACTVPRCGDGRHDGGEVCDDGNTVSGDGCAGDCSRVPG